MPREDDETRESGRSGHTLPARRHPPRNAAQFYEGFWLSRRLEDEDLEVVICDPASLEVVRKKKKAKTDRIDARKMVRALRAWDGGDRDALAPVRVPSVEEEDAKRLLRRRERLVKERIRITNTVGGLLRRHGISGEAQKTWGLREAS